MCSSTAEPDRSANKALAMILLTNILSGIAIEEKMEDVLRMKPAYWALTTCSDMTIAQNNFQR
jgi:hypothetical protein